MPLAQIIKDVQDLTYLPWSRVRHSSGTAGSFLKSYSELGGQKIYYKLSNFDSMRGIIGHECVNEIIVDRLLDVLGVDHLHYSLIHADILVDGQPYRTYLCASADFKQPGENKIALDAYYEREKLERETPIQFCVRNGWETYVNQMLVVDFLILNRDRHGANIEVLRNPKKKTIRLAPLFDHGLSLLFSCTNTAAILAYDILEDKRVNSYIGSQSAWHNLGLISQAPVLRPLQETDKGKILKDLDGIISPELQEQIWNMIWKRWCAYEDFCHS
jgi:hypothetical protein